MELFRPVGADHAYYAEVLWKGVDGAPDRNAVWHQVGGTALSKDHPVDLEFDAVNGLNYHRHIEVDDNYMFTVTDTVTNKTPTAINGAQVWPWVIREDLPADVGKANAFEGAHRRLFVGRARPRQEAELQGPEEEGASPSACAVGGWYGLTDKYWLGAVIPVQAVPAQKGAPAQRRAVRLGGQRRPVRPARPIFGRLHRKPPGDPGWRPHHEQGQDFRRREEGRAAGCLWQRLSHPQFRSAIDWGWNWQWFMTQALFWLFQQVLGGVHAVFGRPGRRR